ncbi:Transposase IS4 [Popillia japonica]|uniref:Transposase IS4 n=1 Tax=Popillia japonica TaxID=7064 RepID=A0AAW1LS20_POPJA
MIKRQEDVKADFDKILTEHLTEAFANFIRFQISIADKSPKGVRYGNDFKQFALTLHLLGPSAYKYMSKIIHLPSTSTLHRITRNWQFNAGFNDFVFAAIKLRVDTLEERNRECVICLDEMSLKSHLFYNVSADEIIGFQDIRNRRKAEIADHALVVMVRGLIYNWKQPLEYFFSHSSVDANELKEIIFESIERLHNIGLNVRLVVSDMGSNFYKLVFKDLKLTEASPYFCVNGKKVHYMFDVPHLLKSTRNNFFSYLFLFRNNEINKKYLEEFYAKDKIKQYRLAPRLTDMHLYPSNFQKMKVKLASQVFSNSVTVGLNTYISFNELPQSATFTAHFIEDMDKLFDVLNSSRFKDCKPLQAAFIGNSAQVTVLQKMKSFFEEVKIFKGEKDITKRMKFLHGWGLTIAAFSELWKDMQSSNIPYLFTRYLNQDCLENYFGKVRNASGNARNPTPIQFARSFKKLFAVQYFHHVEGANCLDDLSSILTNINAESLRKVEFMFQPATFQPIAVKCTDYRLNPLMGIKKSPSYRDYWSVNEDLQDPYISKFMPVKHITFQTNLYAEQVYQLTNKRYSQTNLTEVKTFIGLNLLMGIKKSPSYRDYWSVNEDLQDPYISKFMPVNRFFAGSLHFKIHARQSVQLVVEPYTLERQFSNAI